jgi:hypothetical protein
MSAVDSSQPVKDASLALAYQKIFFAPQPGNETITGFGLLHDGTGTSLPTGHLYPSSLIANTQEFADVRALVMTVDSGTAPAVGYDLTVTTDNRSMQSVLNDINTLESQAALGNCDLAVRGIFQGRQRAFHFNHTSTSDLYLSDKLSDPGYDSPTLLSILVAGDALTWLGVPKGQGIRFGDDRDGDGLLNANEPVPVLSITKSGSAVVLQWPDAYTDWFAETGPSLQGPWVPLTSPRTTTGSLFSIQTTPAPGGRSFFRLRRTW